ncbi:hypothetical protein O6H91_16G028300 [Diphasiastrum complanatum]|uniref:Uncharacterized protein n=1 Tax=Diphasiastrum complanatum TaxID=34168 RepID=A0ACC2BAY8_DIPCM|nr:hypothetical protein O6H91_16G028300 [Diphasiastrum complanatum]
MSEASAEYAKCECCGLQEECTADYIERVRGVFCRHFICGLCAEAVKEEQCQRKSRAVAASVEDALQSHMAVCLQFNNEVRENPAVHVASSSAAMRQLLSRRSESSPPQVSRSKRCLSTRR